MQQFQQQLQQTALLAQQLLAQQVVSQAARGTSSSGTNSRAHSRPSSAATRARHSATAHSSSGSRPGSKGQQRPPAASAAVPQGAARSTDDAAGGGTAHTAGLASVVLTPQLMGLEGVLEVDEPPSAAEVQAYAVYLGMDPVEVRVGSTWADAAGHSKRLVCSKAGCCHLGCMDAMQLPCKCLKAAISSATRVQQAVHSLLQWPYTEEQDCDLTTKVFKACA